MTANELPVAPAELQFRAECGSVSKRLIEDINRKLRQCADDFGMHQRFSFAVYSQEIVDADMAEQLQVVYRRAGWKNFGLINTMAAGVSSNPGYVYHFMIEA